MRHKIRIDNPDSDYHGMLGWLVDQDGSMVAVELFNGELIGVGRSEIRFLNS